MANEIAYLVLFGWPLVVICLFRTLDLTWAIAVSLVAGYLLLPAKPFYNLPLIPPYSKATATTVPVLLMALWVSYRAAEEARLGRSVPAQDVLPGLLPRSRFILACLAAAVVQPVITAMLNGSPLVFPIRVLKGQSLYDGLSAAMLTATALIPFLIGRRYLSSPRQHAIVLTVVAAAAAGYALLALWEVRMSPQLNSQIYGFFPHSWHQHIRSGGFRPVVFLSHGLLLGIFLAMGLIAAMNRARYRSGPMRALFLFAAAGLFVTLILSKTLGALLIGCFLLGAVLFLGTRMQILFAAALAGIVLTYPALRSSGLVSSDVVTSAVSPLAPDGRMLSLEFRLRNEEILLDKANQKPLFGWGPWGRARVFDEEGRDLSTTDGAWIINYGEGGAVGYLGTFGLLCGPILLLALRRRDDLDPASVGVALVLTAHILNLIPNSGMTPVMWMLGGALAGCAERRSVPTPEVEAESAPRDGPAPGEARPAPGLQIGRGGPVYARRLGEPGRAGQSTARSADGPRFARPREELAAKRRS